MDEVYFALIVINFIFLSTFVYEDLKKREIQRIPFYANTLFLLSLIVYSLFFFNLFVVMLFSIFGIGLFLYSKKTGNLGEGDVPVFLSTLLIITLSYNILLIFDFLIFFASASFMLPFIVYKKSFNILKRIIPIFLFAFLTVLVLFNKLELALLVLIISLLYTLFAIYKKIDILYEESVEYLSPSEITSGDLIINSLLTTSQRQIVPSSGRLTLVSKDLLKKLNKKDRYPIYHKSLPMTVPIFIAFLLSIICVII